MMRNPSPLCKRLLCVKVRRCVYRESFSALQSKHLIFRRKDRLTAEPTPTHRRTFTHDSNPSIGCANRGSLATE